jgi:hypothetical protein
MEKAKTFVYCIFFEPAAHVNVVSIYGLCVICKYSKTGAIRRRRGRDLSRVFFKLRSRDT